MDLEPILSVTMHSNGTLLLDVPLAARYVYTLKNAVKVNKGMTSENKCMKQENVPVGCVPTAVTRMSSDRVATRPIVNKMTDRRL